MTALIIFETMNRGSLPFLNSEKQRYKCKPLCGIFGQFLRSGFSAFKRGVICKPDKGSL